MRCLGQGVDFEFDSGSCSATRLCLLKRGLACGFEVSGRWHQRALRLNATAMNSHAGDVYIPTMLFNSHHHPLYSCNPSLSALRGARSKHHSHSPYTPLPRLAGLPDHLYGFPICKFILR
jgi:hypothetical protein